MGTKNAPGKFDCYSKAEPDEPMFVLLGRDPIGCLLVTMWVDVARRLGKDPEKIEEARQCADAMRVYCEQLHAQDSQEELDRIVKVFYGSAESMLDAVEKRHEEGCQESH